jgi:hypothetical protein
LLSEQSLGNEGFRGHLLVLKRVAQFVLVTIVADVISLDVLFYVQGGLYFGFMESLILLLMLEGCLVGVAGGVMYLGLDVVAAVRKKAHNAANTQEQLKRRKEKRELRQRWAITMITAGLLMILIGLLISSLTQI